MNVKRISMFLILIFLMLDISFSSWPEFNYDTYNTGTFGGYNVDLFVKYNSTLWIHKIGSSIFQASPSPSFSTSTLSGTQILPASIYIASSDPNTIYSLNASSGEQFWNFTAPVIGFAGAFVGSPIVYFSNYTNTTYVIAGNQNTFLYVLNASNGEQIWNISLGGQIYSTPAVYNDVIYAAAGSSIQPDFYALNLTDGSIIWSVSVSGNAARSSPTLFNGLVYFTMSRTTTNSIIYALNATNGSIVWNYTIPTENVSIKSSPAISTSLGILYIGVDDGKIYALNATNGSHIWNFSFVDFSSLIVSTPSVIDCSLLSPICGIVLIGADGLYALNATNGSEIWHFYESPYVIASTPAFSKDVVYVGAGNPIDNNGKVYALNISTGSKIWEFSSPAEISSSPALLNTSPYDILYIQDIDGNVYAIGKNEPPLIEVLTPNLPSYTNSTYNITWNASDPNGDQLNISCYGDNDSSGFDPVQQCFVNTSNDGSEVCSTTLWPEGTYYLWCSAWDGELTSYDYAPSTLTVDRTPPYYFNITFFPNSPTTYNSSQNYQFNSTWIDNLNMLDLVWIEHNFTGVFQNYSVNNNSGNTYIYNHVPLPAGNYSIKWYANDSLGNQNSTSYYEYIILKATPYLNLNSSPSWSVNYTTQTNVSCTASSQLNISLYRNGTLIASAFGYVEDISTLAGGTYNYTCNTSGNENYTASGASNILTINKGTPSLNLNVQPSWNVPEGTETNVSCNSDSQLNLSLYRNGTFIVSGFGYVEDVSTLPVGDYNYTCNTTGNENYTATSSYGILIVSSSSGGSGGPQESEIFISYDFICPDDLLLVHTYDENGEDLKDVKVILQILRQTTYTSLDTKYTDDSGNTEFYIYQDGDYRLLAYLSDHKDGEEYLSINICSDVSNDTKNESYNDTYKNTTLNETKNITGNKTKDYDNRTTDDNKGSKKISNNKEKDEKEVISNNEKTAKASDISSEQVETSPTRKSNVIESLSSFTESFFVSGGCCSFGICSFFGFTSFLGLCWYVWIVVVALIALIIYIKNRKFGRKFIKTDKNKGNPKRKYGFSKK